jgi:hypothetical protein
VVLGGASGIQIATLAVAGIAAVASVVGGVVVAALTRRSERTAWLRDLRVRLYSKCMEEAHNYYYDAFYPTKQELQSDA